MGEKGVGNSQSVGSWTQLAARLTCALYSTPSEHLSLGLADTLRTRG